MAMTQLGLLLMAALAAGTGFLGLFANFGDGGTGERWTRVLLLFVSAVIWGIMGISSYDVIVQDSGCCLNSEPIMPLVALGLGLAGITGLFAMSELLTAMQAQASDANVSLSD